MSDSNPYPNTPQSPILQIGGKDGDARVDIFISEDDMRVLGSFFPPKSGKKMLIFSDVEDALANLGVVNGLQNRKIQEAIFQCNTNHKTLDGILLAQGTEPVSEKPAYLKLEERLFNHFFRVNENDASVDFKEYSPFIIVKKGELLARAMKPRQGQDGLTVKGIPIPHGKKEMKFLKPGENTIFVKNQVFARCAGRFFIDREMFHISDLLELPEGVNYSTGHILFPGHLIIGGTVEIGFRVLAGGNIEVKETLDVSEIMSKGNLLCHGGIIGHKPGLLRCGKTLNCQFMENVQAEALEDVHIARNILNSKLYTNGSFSMEEGGKVVASFISCKGNLSCGQLGNDASHSHVIVGTDFVVQRRLEHLRVQYLEEENHLVNLKARMEQVDPQGWARAEEEIRARILQLVNEINDLQTKLFNPNGAEIRVKGDVYPGCLIEMGWAKMEISQLQTGGRIYKLSPDGKSIVTEKIHG